MRQIEIQGCRMELAYLQDETKHSHQDIEIIYIIENCVELELDESVKFEKEDIIIINASFKHRLKRTRDTVAFRLFIPYRLLSRLTKDDMIYFSCNSVTYHSDNYKTIKKLMETLILKYLSFDEMDLSGIASIQFQIIHELLEHLRVDSSRISQYVNNHKNSRIDNIRNYINLHYFESLSLAEVAEHFYVSEAYLSRYFKNKTGMNYVNYINCIRADNAALELEKTDKSITNIAVDNGFSTPSVLSRYFKEKYGMTPSDYRRKTRGQNENKMLEQPKADKVKERMYNRLVHDSGQDRSPKRIKAVISEQTAGWVDKNSIINIGEASTVSGANIQSHILFLKEVLNIGYIRIWNLFSEEFMITKNFGGDSFNFDCLDRIFDFFVQNKINLFLDLGKRDRVIMADSDNALFSVRTQYNLKDKSEWKNLIEHFMRHLIRRYGQSILENWIFEFPWNKETYYETEYDYIEAYEIGQKIIRNKLGKCKIAGLCPNSSIYEEQILQAVRRLKQHNTFPDILTLKIFPDYYHQMMEDAIYKADNECLYARQFIEKIKNIVEAENIDCQLCVSTWSNSLSNRNVIQDSCARGTYIVNFVLSTWKLVDMMGVWYGSDAVDIYYDSKKLIYGGGGMLTKDGIKKPSFYAFEFLGKLGKELIKVGDNYIITRDSSGMIICLCFNHKEYSYYYYLKKEKENLDLSKVFQNQDKTRLEFSIEGLEDGSVYIIKEEVINNKNGSIQDEWGLLGNQEELGKEEIQYLKNTCIPKMYMKQSICLNKSIDFQVELDPHEMRMIYIYKY